MRSEFPQISPFYIRRPGRTIFHIYEPWNLVGVPSFSHFHEPKMPPELWASQLRQREQRPKILLSFNQTRKRTILLRPRTVASASRARSLMNLQVPIKNVQELAKEEGEESEANLKEAIEILEGDHLHHCRRLARLLGGNFLGVQILASG